MEILCCREANSERCNVDLGRIYAGNCPSIEMFLADSKKLHPVIEQVGSLYDDEEREAVIEQWKLSGHEVHKSTQPGRFDAVVILYYEPVLEGVVAEPNFALTA